MAEGDSWVAVTAWHEAHFSVRPNTTHPTLQSERLPRTSTIQECPAMIFVRHIEYEEKVASGMQKSKGS